MRSFVTVWVRVYEELNDYLPPDRRKHTFALDIPEPTNVARLLSDLAIPAAQVDLVLADGTPVGLSHNLRGGERISIYPVFERFDIAGVTKFRAEPLRVSRFLADSTLRPLAGYLRLLGFDTEIREGPIEGGGQRILVTRNPEPVQGISHACVLTERKPREQLQEILSRLDLYRSVRLLGRCLSCNSLISAPKAFPLHCVQCGRIFREGVHLKRMLSFVDRVLQIARI